MAKRITLWKDGYSKEIWDSELDKFLSLGYTLSEEKKSTKKKKKVGRGMHPHDEIKPMSGTNTITINPEDESSKYKRGY